MAKVITISRLAHTFEVPEAATGSTYWIEWCSSSYRRHNDGFITHAVADPGNGHALCGAKTNDSGGGEIPTDGEPGCIRCRTALRKLGIIGK